MNISLFISPGACDWEMHWHCWQAGVSTLTAIGSGRKNGHVGTLLQVEAEGEDILTVGMLSSLSPLHLQVWL